MPSNSIATQIRMIASQKKRPFFASVYTLGFYLGNSLGVRFQDALQLTVCDFLFPDSYCWILGPKFEVMIGWK